MIAMPATVLADKSYSLWQRKSKSSVVEIFQTMKESSRDHNSPAPTKSYSSAASLTSLCPDISPSNSQFFEVLYVGKIKVSHRNVPDTFIDDGLQKIKLHELKKAIKLIEKDDQSSVTINLDRDGKILNSGTNCLNEKDKVLVSSESDRGDEERICDDRKKLKSSFSHDDIHSKIGLQKSVEIKGNVAICDITNTNDFNGSTNTYRVGAVVTEDGMRREFRRARTGSLGVIETFKKKSDESSHNRTMLFYVGKTDLRLISPDRKQVLFHEKLTDIVSCIQGIQHSEHFGFICREVDCYIGYLFKCESGSVAGDIVSVISQSFQSTKEVKELKQPVLSCEHCPMVWFHKLCSEIEGFNDKKTLAAILKKIDTLPAEEQDIIRTKFLGTESSNVKEQNEFLMILLRTHCETKQIRHIHDTAENRSEFLNQYLGGSTIFMKAKRSLTNSFDHLLKRKGSQIDSLLQHTNVRESLDRKSSNSLSDCDSTDCQKSHDAGKKDIENRCKQNEIEQLRNHFRREKSIEYDSKNEKIHSFSDIAALAVNNQKIGKAILQKNVTDNGNEDNESNKTPMLNIFLKVGSTTKSPTNDKFSCNEISQSPDESWRQAIFNRVVTPGKAEKLDNKICRMRTKEELRELWKKAINQQLLLIRMEKENAKLRVRQEEATVKRIKLEYDELGNLNKEYMGIWELISNKDSRLISSKCDYQMMLQAIRQGVPPSKRGDVWHFLAVQHCLKQPPFDSTCFPNYDVPYEDLLKHLTSFQHAILIDLGRTFPNHPYFSSPLGPGQLALFNLLKAYSLLDPQVGYCQGLSFIAGVLLLHMSEENAFLLLRHLMFRRGIRKQYLPDMAALQVQLYQLTRLLYDTLPRLYAHFDINEIAPALYAAPWMLTLFASQFPLGFVTRVFDLLFLEHTTDIIFRVILALLEEHMEFLLASSTFEEIMNYLKNEIPNMTGVQVEKVMKRALTMDISKRLHEYEVEYHVLQEEMSTPRPKFEELKKLELENRRLIDQNLALIDQLEVVNNNSTRLEKTRSAQYATINKLETQVRNLEITVATLADFIADVFQNHNDIEIPGDIRRVISNVELAKSRSTKPFFQKKSDKGAVLKKSHTSMGFIEKDYFHQSDAPVVDLQNELNIRDTFPVRADNVDGFMKKDLQKTNSSRGAPLNVIIDEDDEEKIGTNFNSSNLTSKFTSGVSSLFNHPQNQIKTDRNKACFQKNFYTNIDKRSSNLRRNSSNDLDVLCIRESLNNFQNKDQSRKEEVEHVTDERDLSNADCKSDLIKNDYPVPFHPLDACSDVNITYNGTTKLKSIKSGNKLNRNNIAMYCE